MLIALFLSSSLQFSIIMIQLQKLYQVDIMDFNLSNDSDFSKHFRYFFFDYDKRYHLLKKSKLHEDGLQVDMYNSKMRILEQKMQKVEVTAVIDREKVRKKASSNMYASSNSNNNKGLCTYNQWID